MGVFHVFFQLDDFDLGRVVFFLIIESFSDGMYVTENFAGSATDL